MTHTVARPAAGFWPGGVVYAAVSLMVAQLPGPSRLR
jgi:hypothetical protein